MTPHPVIVLTDSTLDRAIRTQIAYHPFLPELRGEGPTPEAAHSDLTDRLARALADTADEFHRDVVRRALEAVLDSSSADRSPAS